MRDKIVLTLLLTALCSGCVVPGEKPLQSTTPKPTTSIQARLDVANKAYQQGAYQQALEQYRLVVEMDNYHRKANYNITIIYLELMIKGMEFLGQFIDSPQEASEARVALDQLIEQAGIFTRLTSKYMD